MAGHSKWANIKHRKARVDQKRGKEFTRLIREITVAACIGAPVVEDNPRLRAAVDKALASNMPKDTIQRAIKRGAGRGEGKGFEKVTYEGYGPGGIAILVEVMTDSRNRAVAAVRHCFNKYNGNLGTDGSVAYLFEQKGQISLSAEAALDSVIEIALEAGADDVIEHGAEDLVEVFTAPNDLMAVTNALTEGGHEPIDSTVDRVPATLVELELDDAAQAIQLLNALEDVDDVHNVFSNGSFPDTDFDD